MKKRVFVNMDKVDKRIREEQDCRPDRVNAVPVRGRDAIEKKDNLIESILALLETNFRGEHHLMKDKVLFLCVLDSIFYNSLILSDFCDELESKVSDELGLVFDHIEVSPGPQPQDTDLTRLSAEVHIGIKSVPERRVAGRALIRPVAHRGSLIAMEYILDREAISKLPNGRYNIGIGQFPVMPDGTHRENHIAIDDNPDAPEYEKNKFISRAHAFISFSEEFGFLLHVEFGGTRVAGKRTCIYRGNEKIVLDNPLIAEPLMNGDYIVLSKGVHLQYNEMPTSL